MTGRVLVTGGAGFIGSHVVEAYLAAGWSVEVLDHLERGQKEWVPAGVTLHELDVRSPEAQTVVRDRAFDVLNHHAAQMDVRVSVADPALDADVNIMGLINLLEGARAGGVRRVVFASSGGVVYGDGVPLQAEGHAKLPASPYGASKLASEYYLATYQQLYGLETVSLRYANVYGPRQDPHGEAGVVAIFCERLRRGEPLTIFGDGSQTRDYVYVSDVARINLLASERELPRLASIDACAYNAGTGIETSVNRLAEHLARTADREPEIERAPARRGELQRSALDATKAERELGWCPEVSLEEGLARTYRVIAEG